MKIRGATHTDIGDRPTNQDSADVFGAGGVLVIADGMGGQRGGKVASRVAVDVVRSAVDGGLGGTAQPEAETRRHLRAVVDDANHRIIAEAHARPALSGLGTTLTVAVVGAAGLAFAHVGDSRLYRWRDGDVVQLTQDHTRAAELAERGLLSPERAAQSTQRNVLTRHLGVPRAVEPQVDSVEVRVGDRLLLCSDGLWSMLPAGQLAALLGAGDDAARIAASLVDGAAAAAAVDGGRDNTTAVVALLEG